MTGIDPNPGMLSGALKFQLFSDMPTKLRTAGSASSARISGLFGSAAACVHPARTAQPATTQVATRHTSARRATTRVTRVSVTLCIGDSFDREDVIVC